MKKWKKNIRKSVTDFGQETQTTYWLDGYFNSVSDFIYKHSHTNGFQVYYKYKFVFTTKKLSTAKSILMMLDLEKQTHKQKPY